HSPRHHTDLPSFPTRRSSDLAPLVIDSTEPDVLKAALETCPGRAVINSINMETGRQRIENVLPMALEHGSAVVALTIDEIGMGKDRKSTRLNSSHSQISYAVF